MAKGDGLGWPLCCLDGRAGGCRDSSAGRWILTVMWDYKDLVRSSSLEPQQLCLHRHFQLLVGHWVGLGEVVTGWGWMRRDVACRVTSES